ncbi:MAG: slipin family protein [Cyclobacteriaceae bacterium]
MKRVRIKEGEIGLIFREDNFRKLITKGAYWISSSDIVDIYERTGQFNPDADLRKLSKQPVLHEWLTFVEVAADEMTLLFEYGSFSRLLKPGLYAFWSEDKRYEFRTYNRFAEFVPPKALDLLLENEELANELIVIEVLDEQIAIQYTEGIFAQVLTPGRYAFWKNSRNYSFEMIDTNIVEPISGLSKDLLMRPEFSRLIRAYSVEKSEKGILFIDGKSAVILESGVYTFWMNGTPITVSTADMRLRSMEISGQEILTKDKAGLRINFSVLYRVTDVEKALIDNADYEKQLYGLAQLALRDFIATYTLDELLEKKEAVGKYVIEVLTGKIDGLGIMISEAGVRDIILPGDMKDIMNQVLVAQKKAQANVIMRREETASTRSLLNTAKLMEENDMLFKLKEMEYVEKIAEKIGEITIAGNGQVVEQLKGIFAVK